MNAFALQVYLSLELKKKKKKKKLKKLKSQECHERKCMQKGGERPGEMLKPQAKTFNNIKDSTQNAT